MSHCLTCGTNHEGNCPPEAFRIIACACGNETLMPCDALFMGTQGMYCGQCSKDTDWLPPKIPTTEDMQRHWENWSKEE